MIFTVKSKILISVGLLGACSSCVNKQTDQDTIMPLPVVETIEAPVGQSASLPYLTSGSNHKLYLSWVETAGDTAVFKYAYMDQSGWSASEEIARGTDWFVNWADYPMVAVNGSGNMAAHFLAKSGEAYFSYDVNIVQKLLTDKWTAPLVPHDDGTRTEHGFVTILPTSDNAFQLAWLDGRNTSSEGQEHHGAMTLRAAVLTPDGTLSEQTELDDRVCDCCQTGGTITQNGPVVVYRDRSENEVRDIAIVRKVDGRWTAPQPVYQDRWEIAGCPVNGPRADAHGNDLAIAWFAAPMNKPVVKVIFSEDAGASFGEPIIIDKELPLGRVDLVMLDDQRAMVSWLCKENGKTSIKGVVVHRDGHLEQPFVVAQSNQARASGFPQLAKYQEKLYFAWTHLDEDGQTAVKLAFIENLPLEQL